VWKTSPGGLVSALTPILQEKPSTWIGWAGIAGKAPKPFQHDGIWNHPVAISREEIQTFYEGFCNRTLWPLYHDAVRPPEYHRRWWGPYVDVNRRFAEVSADLVDNKGIVWVNDYQLQLVPSMLRELRKDVRIGFFLHIPFPPEELFAQLPWRASILEGLLGADVIGFQTRGGARNFTGLAKRFTSAEGRIGEISFEGRDVRAMAIPVSIDFKRFQDLANSPQVESRMKALRVKLGEDRKVILGVDRLDYTKGIDIRLRAYMEMLRKSESRLSDSVMVQVAVPSRERVAQYRELRADVERLVGEINGRFGELGVTPVHYLHRNLPIEELVALYRLADVMVVTPLRDGMNLVAKEYAATRIDDSGVLVLSEFTGSARELSSALLVNPHDVDGLQAALDKALDMPMTEQKSRMRSIRRIIERHDVYDWAQNFYEALGS
jgi:alpha,alpha-trehalose-phosphate synthase [UDP-forming]